MDFISIDFETANQKQSPCALGFVLVENNTIIKEYYTLINPEQSFSRYNVAVHGITAKEVAEAPTFKEVWEIIGHYFKRYPVVAHNASFEKQVLEKAVRRYNIEILPIAYYCTMNLYKYNYPSAESLNLSSVSGSLGVKLENHHNALSDAKGAAKVMLVMLSDIENAIFPTTIGDIYLNTSTYNENKEYEIFSQPLMIEIEPELSATTASIDEIEEIIFNDSTFVLTGIIVGYERTELEAKIIERGGKVTGSVSKKTNYVISGLQDTSVVKDKDGAKSSKILKAEALRDEGYNIKIIDSNTFLTILQK